MNDWETLERMLRDESPIRAVLEENERLEKNKEFQRGMCDRREAEFKAETDHLKAENERLRAEAARLEEKRIELLEAIRVARDRLEGAGGVLSALDVDP